MASVWEWLLSPGLAAVDSATVDNLGTGTPNAEANITFATLATRWSSLEGWAAQYNGIPSAIPSAKLQYEAWLSFSHDWTNGKPDVTRLQAATADLYNAEQVATQAGYKNPFDPNPVKAPAIDQTTQALQDAQGVSDAAAKAQSILAPRNIPWWAYAAAGGAAILVTVAAGIALRATPQATLLRRVAGEDD